MDRNQVMTQLSSVQGIDVQKLEGTLEVVSEQGGGLLLNSAIGPRELSDGAASGLYSRLKISGGIIDKLSTTTRGRVLTELLEQAKPTSMFMKDGEVTGFVERGRYHAIPVDRVLDAVENAFETDIDYHRVTVFPNHDVRVEVLGETMETIAVGDIVQAGTMVQFNPMGISSPRVQSYGLRLTCTNGMTSQDVLATYALSEHSMENLDAWLESAVVQSYEGIEKSAERWRAMREEAISAEDRALVLGGLARQARLKKDDAAALWSEVVEHPPQNTYDVLNLLTWMSSHVVEDPDQVRRLQDVSANFVQETTHHKFCPTCKRVA